MEEERESCNIDAWSSSTSAMNKGARAQPQQRRGNGSIDFMAVQREVESEGETEGSGLRQGGGQCGSGW